MKLPWRYAISVTIFTAGVAAVYTWQCRMAIQEAFSWTLPRHEEPYAVDSRKCDGSHHSNQNDESGIPFLTCSQIKEIVLDRKIGEGAVKQVYLGRWRGRRIAYSSLTHPLHLEDFLHGAKMLQAMQPSELVVRLLGVCLNTSKPVIITEYHELGSVDNIEDVLSQERSSDTIRTRFQMCLDYVRILTFLHSSPAGMRVMCDSNDINKTLSQFLFTDALRLVINDLDALPQVDHTKDVLVKCGHKQLFGNFVAPEQLWPFAESFQDSNMLPYDEKTDIWKVPDVTDTLLGKVNHSDILRFHLFKIHRRCKETNPVLRPTADEILQEYQETFHSIVDEDH